MGDLRAAAEEIVIHRREVILERNAGADRTGREQDAFDDLAFVVADRIVGNQEDAAIEKKTAAQRAASDEGGGIGRVTEFRARLRDVVGAPAHVAQRQPGIRPLRRRGEPATALGGMCPAGLTDLSNEGFEPRLESARHGIEVVPLDAIVAGVVLGGDEAASLGNVQATRCQPGAHRRPVGHAGEDARIGATMLAGTGAAGVGRVMRVVAAARTVAEDQDQRREVVGQADHAQEGFHPVDLLQIGKTGLRLFRRAGIRLCGGQRQLRRQAPFVPGPPALDGGAEPARRQRRRGQRGEGRHAGQRRQQRPAQGLAAGRLVEAFAPAQAFLALRDMPRQPGRSRGPDGLAHEVGRLHDDRAERALLRVIKALPPHRHAEETGGAVGNDVRRDFLEMAARAFLAVVHAHHDLGRGCRHGKLTILVGAQAGEQLLAIMPLVGEQP